MTAVRVFDRFSEGPADGSSATGALDQFSGSTQSGVITSETFSAADALRPPYCWKIAANAGQTYKGFAFPMGAVANSYHTMFVNFSAVPSALTVIAQIMSGATVRAQLVLNGSGKVITRSPSLAVGVTGSTIIAGIGWVRIEWDCVGTVQTVRLYTGDQLFGTTPTETLTPGASSITISGHDRIRLGLMQNNYTGNAMWDEYVFDSDAAPGPMRIKTARGWGLPG